MKYIAIALTLMSLVACATKANIKINNIMEKARKGTELGFKCYENYSESDEANYLKNKYVFFLTNDPNKPYHNVINNDNYPTDRDKEVLISLRAKKQNCIDIFSYNFGQAHHEISSIFYFYYKESDNQLILLFEEKITIGDFNKKQIQNTKNILSDLAKAIESIKKDIRNDPDKEIYNKEILWVGVDDTIDKLAVCRAYTILTG